ncbi:MAG: polysaccharide deacetylase family protein [Lachnospiraceae bacterium]|nr:polysaccharide deacetylase family protein [Lachnospiraceae bacterium]MDD3794523.1 polysaccharide deacetylase family protein [Lachnospiraceae bacterium]
MSKSAGHSLMEAVEVAPQVALTFDDGPHPVYTKLLLDGLKERGVKATFFVLGENIEGNQDLLQRMAGEGHLIGNHTYSHRKLCDMCQEEAVNEIMKTSSLVKGAVGEGTEYIRPPFGEWSARVEYEVAMFPVLWTVDTLDWTTKNVPLTVERATAKIKDQDIILFHDFYASSVQSALRTVDILLEKGYEFVTVDQIILE